MYYIYSIYIYIYIYKIVIRIPIYQSMIPLIKLHFNFIVQFELYVCICYIKLHTDIQFPAIKTLHKTHINTFMFHQTYVLPTLNDF